MGQDSPGKTPFCPSGSHQKPHSSPQDSTRNPLHTFLSGFSWNPQTLCWNSMETTFSVRIHPESFSVEFRLGIKTLNVSFPLPLSHKVRYILLKSVNLQLDTKLWKWRDYELNLSWQTKLNILQVKCFDVVHCYFVSSLMVVNAWKTERNYGSFIVIL